MSFTAFPSPYTFTSILAWRLVFLAIALPCVLSEDSRPSGRVIVQVDDPSTKYKGLVATFGNPLEQDLQVNIMLPPDYETDPYLCEYPQSLLSRDNVLAVNYSQPIALFVAIGGPCSAEDKARVLLRMQREVSSSLQVLLVYETNPKFPNGVKSLAPDSDEPSPELDDVALMKLPFRYVERMKNKMWSGDSANPVFLRPGSESWSFLHSIGGGWVTIDTGYGDRGNGTSTNSNTEGSDRKPWTRYLFICIPLLLAPWFWAAYMCQTSTRVAFRRNENGVITGLRYVR